MKQRKIPLRTCVVTKEKLEKKDLIRVVKNNENQVFVDLTGKANGRGAYIKRDLDVLTKAKKFKVLDKHLEIEIKDDIYEELSNIINSKN
ncbi:MAG: YlxR family protein [Bacilli bacterium]|nr:YlxR family protein [Bacilli bacterium]MBP3635471.1 YlxR family protein [Bacilli bacterium]